MAVVPGAAPVTHPIRAFFVSASATMRGLYARQLANSGLELTFADSFDYARHRASQTRPDFLIVDLEDLAKGTVETCRKFMESFPDVRVLLLCPVGEADRGKRLIGAPICLNKPANPTQVTNALDNALIEEIEKLLAKRAREEAVVRSHTDPATALDTIPYFEKTRAAILKGDEAGAWVSLISGRIDDYSDLVAAHAPSTATRLLRRFGEAVRSVLVGEHLRATAIVDDKGFFHFVITGVEPERAWGMLTALPPLLVPADAGAPAEPALTITAVMKTGPSGGAATHITSALHAAFEIAMKLGTRDRLFWLDEVQDHRPGTSPG